MGVIRRVGAGYNGAVSIDYQRNMAGCLPFSPTALDLRIGCLNGEVGRSWNESPCTRHLGMRSSHPAFFSRPR